MCYPFEAGQLLLQNLAFFHLGDGSVSFFFSSPKCVQSKVYGAGAVRGAAVRSV